MIHYRKILELYFNKISQRSISTSVGSSRKTIAETIKKAQALGLEGLTEEMNNQWLEEFLFPEKLAVEKRYFPQKLGNGAQGITEKEYYSKTASYGVRTEGKGRR